MTTQNLKRPNILLIIADDLGIDTMHVDLAGWHIKPADLGSHAMKLIALSTVDLLHRHRFARRRRCGCRRLWRLATRRSR